MRGAGQNWTVRSFMICAACGCQLADGVNGSETAGQWDGSGLVFGGKH